MNTARNEDPPVYLSAPAGLPPTLTFYGPTKDALDAAVIASALQILEARARKPGTAFDAPHVAKDFLRLKLGGYDYEVFGAIYLDSQHRLIEFVEHFAGTLAQTTVYPREIVKRALKVNAGAVILAHNHPSGDTKPSRADQLLTSTLKGALAMVDVRVLDHMVVSATGVTSFAEAGLL